MINSIRHSGIALAAVLLTLAGLAVTHPAGAATAPRYVVSVTKLTAVDESGADWLGSDEVYGGFQATDPRTGAAIAGFRSHLINGFDTGESKNLHADKNCLPARHVLAFESGRTSFYDARAGDRWLCSTALPSTPTGIAAPFVVTGQLYEDDDCILTSGCARERNQVLGAWQLGDQDLGRAALSFTAEGLAADLTAIGLNKSYPMHHRYYAEDFVKPRSLCLALS